MEPIASDLTRHCAAWRPDRASACRANCAASSSLPCKITSHARPAAPALFTVDEWKTDSSGIIRNLVKSNERGIAQTAYDAAKAVLPHGNITLRTGIRIIRSSVEEREEEAWRTPDKPGL